MTTGRPESLGLRQRLRSQVEVLRRNTPLRQVVMSRFVSTFGTGMAPIGLAFASLDDSAIGVRGLGYAVAANVAGGLVFLAVGGVVSDRVGPRRSMLAADVQAALVQLAIAVLFMAHVMTVGLLVPLSFLLGISDSLSEPAMASIIRRLTDDNGLNAANAGFRGLRTTARAVSAPVGGVLVALVGAPFVLVIDAVSYLGSAVLLMRARCPVPARRGSILADLREGWAEVRSRSWLLTITVGSAVVNVARAGGISVLGQQALRAAGAGAGEWGVLVGILSVGSVLSLWTVGQLRPRRVLMVSMAWILLVAAFLAGLALAPNLLVLAPLALASSGAISFFTIRADWVLQRSVPVATLGRVVGFTNALSTALSPAGALVSGELGSISGPSGGLLVWSGVVVVAVVGVLLVPAVRRFRDDLVAMPMTERSAS